MSALKILYVIPNLLKGGAERLVIDICNELQNYTDVSVKLIVLENKNEFKALSKNIDIEVCQAKVIPSVFKKDTIDISDYEKIVTDFNPDIIHSHLYLAEIVSRENVRPNICYFTHCHDNIIQFETFKIHSLFSKKRMTDLYEKRRLMPKYKRVNNNFIAISKNTEAFLKKNLPGSLRKNIILLPNGVNINAFKNAAYREPGEPIKLVNIGSLVNKKNQVFLLHVIKYLKDNGNEVHLKLLGDGVNRKLLSNEIERLNLSKEVELLGVVDDVQQYLWESDIYVHAALYEPFGLVLIEAMAAGLPVVCTDGKGNTDIIDSGKNGYLVREWTPKVFAEKILQIVLNKKLHREMSDFAKQFSEQFSIKAYVEKLLSLYKKKIPGNFL